VDEDDFRALIAVVEAELRDAGFEDVSDQRHYAEIDRETGERRLMIPHRRLIEILRAFGRILAVEDRATYEIALHRMAERLRGGESPRGAVVVPTADNGDAIPIDLGAAPELGEVRHALAALIERLSKTDGGPSESRRRDG